MTGWWRDCEAEAACSVAGRKCSFYKDGVHRFVFYGNVAECRCTHKLTRVNRGRKP